MNSVKQLKKYFKAYSKNPFVFNRVIAIEKGEEVFKGVLFYQGKIGRKEEGYEPHFISCTHNEYLKAYL